MTTNTKFEELNSITEPSLKSSLKKTTLETDVKTMQSSVNPWNESHQSAVAREPFEEEEHEPITVPSYAVI